MFCTNCGKQLPEEAKVCTNCGTRLEYIQTNNVSQDSLTSANSSPVQQASTTAENPSESLQKSAVLVSEPPASQEIPAPAPAPAPTPAPVPNAAPASQGIPAYAPQAAVPAPAGPGGVKKNNKALIFGGIGLGVLIIGAFIAIVLILNLSNRIDLTKYIDVTVDGYNGYGRVTYEIDTEKMLNEIYKVDSIGELSSAKDIQTLSQLSNVTFDVDGSIKNVSNGDKVTIKIKNLEAIQKKTGLSFNGNDTIEYTVEGLEEPSSFSANDIFEASFVGFNGAGCVELTINDDKLPFNMKSSWGNSITVNDYYYLNIKTSENEGKLSNGDEFKVTLAEDDNLSDSLLSEYGMYIDSNTEAVFTVSGLEEAEEFDIFQYVEIKASGVDGSANLTYHWNETEISVGNIVVSVEDEAYSNFRLSSKVQTPENALVITDGESSDTNDELKNIGTFYIEADKSNSISGGDTINLKVTNGYSEIAADEYASYGLYFSNLTKEMNIDGADLDRFITSAKKVNKDNILAFSDTVTDMAKQQILDNWAYYVYNTYSFICYDQEITSCKPAGTAYFVCTSKSSNNYNLCIPFQCKVKDSELANEKTVYILMKVNSPLISASTDEIKADKYSISYDRIESLADVSDRLKWLADGEDSITEIKLK